MYKQREIVEVKWIKRDSNLINAITKSNPLNALKHLLDINIL